MSEPWTEAGTATFVVAVASDEIVERVETFHRRRHQLGLYTEEPE